MAKAEVSTTEEVQAAEEVPVIKKPRKAPKRRPVFLYGVKAVDVDGNTINVDRITYDGQTRDGSEVLEWIRKNPDSTYVRIAMDGSED